MKPFLLFCIWSCALFAYQEGDAVYRTAELSIEGVGSLEIAAEVSVVATRPLKLKVMLSRISATTGVLGEDAFDSESDLADTRWEWWRGKRLRYAMAQPFYLTLEDETFSLTCDDLSERYAVWPELLTLLTDGSAFDLLFGPEFILVGQEVSEGLLFQRGDETICVEKVKDDKIVATLQGAQHSAVLTWNREKPLLFCADFTYETEAILAALAIQSLTETPK